MRLRPLKRLPKTKRRQREKKTRITYNQNNNNVLIFKLLDVYLGDFICNHFDTKCNQTNKFNTNEEKQQKTK